MGNSIQIKRAYVHLSTVSVILFCLLSVCETPAAIENGHLNILDEGFRATYNCSLGYVIKGDMERQCGRDGSGWTGAAPVCGTVKSIK